MPMFKDWFLGLSKAGQAAVIGAAVAVGGVGLGAMAEPAVPQAQDASMVRVIKPISMQKTETEDIEMPFDETVRDDPTLPRGERKIVQAGAVGLKTVTHTINLIDGKETSRRTSEIVATPPIAQVTAVGSYVAPLPARNPSGGGSAVQQSEAGVVKLSKNGICHAPGTTYYSKTKSFTGYNDLQSCLDAGGRMPKK